MFIKTKLADLKAGDILIASEGFECIPADQELIVGIGSKGDLYVPCEQGKHFLDGDLDDETGEYILGFRKLEELR